MDGLNRYDYWTVPLIRTTCGPHNGDSSRYISTVTKSSNVGIRLLFYFPFCNLKRRMCFSGVNPLQDPHKRNTNILVYSVFLLTFLVDYSFGCFASLCEARLFAPDSDTNPPWLLDSSQVPVQIFYMQMILEKISHA